MGLEAETFDASELEQDVESVRVLAGKAAEPEHVDDAYLIPLRERVTSQISEERGLVANLRSRPTWQRMTMVVALGAVLTLISAFATPRSDMAEYPVGHMVAVLSILFLLVVAAGVRLLRPLFAPPPNVWAGRLLLCAGILMPFIFAVVPIDHVGAHAGEGAAFAVHCGKCLTFGAVLGLPVLLVAFFVRRAHVDGAAVGALAEVAAGLTGTLALQVHCPITDLRHLILGHCTLLLVFSAIAMLWRGK